MWPTAYQPNIIYSGEEPKEFSCIPLTSYPDCTEKTYDSIFDVLIGYYSEKEKYTRMKQKSSDLRKIVQTALERTSKKYDLQLRQLKDTEKREKFKVYGELTQTYGYGLEPNAKSLTCMNYYTNEEITIPLDPTKTPLENSKKFFAKYNKLKRTYEALSELVVETKADLDHLDSISTALSLSEDEKDLQLIKDELSDYGYIKSHGKKKGKKQAKSKPLHFVSSDGFHMYVGKNNYQNDELSFKFANGGDWWFHAKNMAGSHVIVRKEQAETLPDATFEEAGRLAAYYSKGRQAPKVEIDYVQRKELRKPPKAKPGFVIYHTNYSITWACYDDKNGQRQYEWGHYGNDLAAMEQDFSDRVKDYQRLYHVGIVQTEAPGLYKYYSTQRPVDIGTFPKPPHNAPDEIVNYDRRIPVEGGAFLAWGHLTYTRPLTEKEASDYELRPAPVISELSRKNDDRPLSIAQQMKEAGALAEASQGDPIHKKKAPDRGDR